MKFFHHRDSRTLVKLGPTKVEEIADGYAVIGWRLAATREIMTAGSCTTEKIGSDLFDAHVYDEDTALHHFICKITPPYTEIGQDEFARLANEYGY